MRAVADRAHLPDTAATAAFLELVASNHQEQERRRACAAAVPPAARIVSATRPDPSETVINYGP